MIQKQRTLFYFVGDKAFKSLEEAQRADLMTLVNDQLRTCPVDNADFSGVLADWLLKNSDAIIDTLTTTPRSRLKARKSHGATRKPRTPKTKDAATPPNTPK